MTFRVREIIRNILFYLFMSNKNDLSLLPAKTLNFERNNLEYSIHSSIITICKNDKEIKYFRECFIHQNITDYIWNGVNDYFRNVNKNPENKQFENIVTKDLKEKSNFKKFINMGKFFEYNLLEILSGEFNNYTDIGLPGLKNDQYRKEFLEFIQYMYCVIGNQRTNKHLKNGIPENCNANKQLATYYFAKMLGIEYLIPKVETCFLIYDGKKRFGTLMDQAKGEMPAFIKPEDRINVCEGSFYKAITNLEFFDALCYQLDHRIDNYNIVRNNNGEICTINAFDNDAPRTFFAWPYLPTKTYAGCSGVISKGKKLNRPYIDKNFVDKLVEISEESLRVNLCQYLSNFQIRALWIRIKRLRKAIRNTEELKVVNDAQWNEIDFDLELKSCYGSTYYDNYLHDTVMIDRENNMNTERE